MGRICFRRERPGFTLVELLAVIAIVGVLTGLLLPAVQTARESARRSSCQGNLKQVALAVLNYEHAMGRFPRNGKQEVLRSAWMYATSPPAVSGSINYEGAARDYGWMFAILPYVEQQAMYDRALTSALTNASAGGKSPLNNSEKSRIVPAFRCPSDPASFALQQLTRGGPFNYYCNYGDTFYSEYDVVTRAPFGWYSNNSATGTDRRMAHILDGTGNTIMLGEVCSATVGISPGVSAANTGWPSVSTVKGVVRAAVNGWGGVGPNLSPQNCLNYADLSIPGTWCSGEYGPGILWNNFGNTFFFTVMPPNSPTCSYSTAYRGCGGFNNWPTASSYHDGGAMFAMCDGSVRFIGDSIDAGSPSQLIQGKSYTGPSVHGVYGRLGSARGGESARLDNGP